MNATGGLRVIRPGLHTTVQDLGRFGMQAFGVPVSGALDSDALRLANALVGNDPGEAALEILHSGPELEITAPSLRLALAAYGGEMIVEGTPRRSVPPWRSATLARGTRLRVVASRAAVCAYLAVGGGLDVELVAGSRATCVRAGLGGWHGRALVAGEQIPVRQATPPRGPELRLAEPWAPPAGPLRIVPGPQEDCFMPEAITTLCDSEYMVTNAADRMGLRLEGPTLRHRAGHDIVSDGTVTGAIQVPGSGQPVLLLADRQTTGGYPKIGAVCTADLPRAGRLRPRDRVRFTVIGVEEAQAARRWHEAELAATIAGIVAETS
jgi:biotin-dependent carboxylase-like uncharacterized protein